MILIHETTFKNVVYETAAILFMTWFVKPLYKYDLLNGMQCTGYSPGVCFKECIVKYNAHWRAVICDHFRRLQSKLWNFSYKILFTTCISSGQAKLTKLLKCIHPVDVIRRPFARGPLGLLQVWGWTPEFVSLWGRKRWWLSLTEVFDWLLLFNQTHLSTSAWGGDWRYIH